MAIDTPESLVKFCTCKTALTILDSQNLRWQAAHLFDDPFELNHETQLTFDPHTLLEAAIRTATAMIFSPDIPRGNTPLLNAVRRWREEERFNSPDEARDVLRELLSRMVDHRQEILDQVMTDWRKFNRDLRICTFSNKPNNIAAWQNHANNHHGIAIRFQAGEHTGLPKPQPVDYRNSRPEITSLKENLDAILTNQQFSVQDLFYEKFTSKSAISAAEQEWRCFRTTNEAFTSGASKPEEWYSDVKFEADEVNAVYFGIHTDRKVKQVIFKLVKEKYKQAKVFEAKTVEGKYEIAFERITKI